MSVATRFFQLLCNKAIPVSATWMTRRGYLDKRHCPPGRPKLQCPYSYGFIRGIDSANE
ncbi:hypothetical protein R0F62_01855 [Wolbachia endosymbiont of Drosophila aff. chauvacae BK-2020]|uniref:hypothetical protein n=1 Tax=unclassified Wolbachia TaxID=2640676 RepID=UPI001BFD2511|nr:MULTISPECIES: hypothetical protein [unclassified Wolbachia]MDE5059939.1 hypothetical protein [Wolbachia endosymbiont of Drosophila burlai]MDU8923233.1 hypothetical protein [Wolbachia endosymbiont of Drosophila seguyi]MDX5507745.1 hypothetical protein [Wolbachia endosymbiont of Hylaeus sinuatus]WOE63073.1 hypothetical protein R0F62_01855 [Wolbachia endosymbiont of Drosophila aff. chauvacae BK-2020]